MNIVWVTSEAAPYAKTGGLADVSAALPKALSERGHKVSVIMPYYPQVFKDLTAKTSLRYELLGVPFGWTEEWAQVREHKISDNLSFFFIAYDLYFDRPSLYDFQGTEYGDNAARFIFFSRAAMQAVLALDLKPDILHCNDWTSAFCNIYLKTPLYWDFDNFKNCKSVITIHNIGYQGVFDKNNLFLSGLGWEYFNHTCLEYHDKLNFMKAGIMTADMVNAVSPTYAKEIMTPDYGFTLDPVLHHVSWRGKLKGILNGIDQDEWNPATDKFLPAKYDKDKMEGKKACKAALQKEFGLPVNPDVPVFGIVSRLASQKGIDAFGNAIENLLYNEDLQVVILGTGDKELEGHLNYLNGKYPDKFSVYLGFSNKLSHLVEAGSDFFVMPSRYEPCGLNQMYSMRYGTIPIVRGTGGLEDTVVNYDPAALDKSTGFKFYILSDEAIRNTLKWAIGIYRNEPENFKKIVYNGMATDFSWDRTASEYEAMYNEAFK
ncbi:MAG TPA: glycogen synthase GlgA [Lentisphaeria bacterium]|nr:MAG: starch synthase [Lentisphaerae bacterium GWF2_38_69]HBM14943.1 glycogen synthase GlgA [Lentisphaeria bacterium]